MNDSTPPVAARIDAAALQTDANLHVQVGAPTKRFHLWVQGPAWLLGFAAVALGFVMVLRGYDSPAGWFAVSTAITLAVVGSFRAPFSLGETAVSTSPGPRRKSKPPIRRQGARGTAQVRWPRQAARSRRRRGRREPGRAARGRPIAPPRRPGRRRGHGRAPAGALPEVGERPVRGGILRADGAGRGTGSRTSAGGGPSRGLSPSCTIVISNARSGFVVVGHGSTSPLSKSRRSHSPYWKSKLGG